MMGDFENTGRSGTSTMRVTEKAVCTYVSFHLTTPFPLTITLVSQSTAQLRRSDTKLEGLVVEMTRASLITHTHPHNLFLVLQSPACFPFRTLSIPIHLRPPFFYGSHPRPFSGFASLPPSPLICKERERRLRKKSRPHPEGRIELVDMTGRYSFSHGEGPMKNGSATPCG